MKLVREAISFQRYKDPKEALFGWTKPGRILVKAKPSFGWGAKQYEFVFVKDVIGVDQIEGIEAGAYTYSDKEKSDERYRKPAVVIVTYEHPPKIKTFFRDELRELTPKEAEHVKKQMFKPHNLEYIEEIKKEIKAEPFV